MHQERAEAPAWAKRPFKTGTNHRAKRAGNRSTEGDRSRPGRPGRPESAREAQPEKTPRTDSSACPQATPPYRGGFACWTSQATPIHQTDVAKRPAKPDAAA